MKKMSKFDIHEKVKAMSLEKFQGFNEALSDLEEIVLEQLRVEQPDEVENYRNKICEQRLLRDRVEIQKIFDGE